MIIKSGDRFKIAPNHNNTIGLMPFHKIDDSLRVFRYFGSFDSTFLFSEDTPIMGGDRRLSPSGLPKASWGGEKIARCGLDTFFDFINFDPETDLDAYVTIRTWNKHAFQNYSATLQYLSDDKQDSNELEVSPWLFTFIDLVLL